MLRLGLAVLCWLYCSNLNRSCNRFFYICLEQIKVTIRNSYRYQIYPEVEQFAFDKFFFSVIGPTILIYICQIGDDIDYILTLKKAFECTVINRF